MDAGCKDCTKRRAGCHSTCKKYIEFKEKGERIKKEKAKRTSLTAYRIKKISRSKRFCRNY